MEDVDWRACFHVAGLYEFIWAYITEMGNKLEGRLKRVAGLHE